jgi:hypothetical protein
MRFLDRVLAPLLAPVTALLFTAVAQADPTIHLAWDDCGASGTTTKAFACDSNVGGELFVLSFVPPAGIDHFFAFEAKLQVMTSDGATTSIPDWWQLVNCRNGSLLVDQDFQGGSYACADPWLGQALGAATFSATNGRISAVATLPSSTTASAS